MSWDDTGMLAKQAERLEKERDDLRASVEALREALKQKQASRDEQAKALGVRRKTRMILALAVGQFAIVGIGVGGYAYAKYVQAETLRGRVTAVRGPAPAALDEACTVAIEPAYLPYNATLQIDCARQRVYGYDALGHIQCETRDQRAVVCLDDDTILEGGDARVRLDRERGRVEIDDGRRWGMTITLAQ